MSAERYLRLLVERALDPFADGHVALADVASAGDALVSVGLADLDLVTSLTADLTLAMALRRPQVRPLPTVAGPGPAPLEGATPLPRTVATGPSPLGGDPGVSVTSLSFGADGATVQLRSAAGPPSSGASFSASAGSLPRPDAVTAIPSRSRGGATGSRRPNRPRSPESPEPTGLRPGSAGLHGAGPRPGGRTRALVSPLVLSDGDGGEWVLERRPGTEVAGEQDGQRRWAWTASLSDLPPSAVARLSVRTGSLSARPSSSERTSAPKDGLEVHGPFPTVTARHHGRSAGSWWVLERLWSATAALAGSGRRGTDASRLADARALPAGIAALVAVDALDPADPLVHQARLLAGAVTPGGVEPALDRRWASPLERRDAEGRLSTEAVSPVATTVDLGTLAVRLDALAVDSLDGELFGAVNRWSWSPPRPVVISAFDDRHNWYTVTPRRATAPAAGGAVEVVWGVRPAIDPAASSLRVVLTGPEREASVEVRL